MRRLLCLLAMSALVGGMAACGDDGGDDDSSAPETTAAQSETTAAAPTTTPLTGDPIRLMIAHDSAPDQGSDYSQAVAGAEAAAEGINARGGIQGRPIEILECVTDATETGAASCARDAVADETVVAMVGNFTSFGGAVDPVLEEAGMASVGVFGIDLPDYSSPISFPVMAGAVGAVGGMATLAVDALGAQQMNVAFLDIPSGQLTVTLTETVLQGRPGATIGERAPVPFNSGDLSAAVATASSGDPGAILLVVTGDDASRFVQTAQGQGVTAPMILSGATFTQEYIDELGDAAEGLYVAAVFPPNSAGGPGNEEYLQEMAAHDEGASTDDLAKNAWLGVRLFEHAARDLATIDRASVLAALNEVTDFEVPGLTPPLDFTQPATFLGGALPRIVNPTVVYAQVQDGEIVALTGEFARPFEPLDG